QQALRLIQPSPARAQFFLDGLKSQAKRSAMEPGIAAFDIHIHDRVNAALENAQRLAVGIETARQRKWAHAAGVAVESPPRALHERAEHHGEAVAIALNPT